MKNLIFREFSLVLQDLAFPWEVQIKKKQNPKWCTTQLAATDLYQHFKVYRKKYSGLAQASKLNNGCRRKKHFFSVIIQFLILIRYFIYVKFCRSRWELWSDGCIFEVPVHERAGRWSQSCSWYSCFLINWTNFSRFRKLFWFLSLYCRRISYCWWVLWSKFIWRLFTEVWTGS